MIEKYNKPFELQDMEYINQNPYTKELEDLVNELHEKDLITTSTGNIIKNKKYIFTPPYLWSYVRLMEICRFKPGMKVLDGGGASSPIVFYLGSKGIDVTTLDLQDPLVKNTKKVADAMGWKTINPLKRDIANTGFPDNYFDVIFSVAVIQSLPTEIKIKTMKEFARILKPGGIIGLVFDFGRSTGKKASYQYDEYDQIHLPLQTVKEIEKYLIEPTGLNLYGNQDLSNKIECDRWYIRKNVLIRAIKERNLKHLIAFPYLFFRSPYFYYNFYSLFFKK